MNNYNDKIDQKNNANRDEILDRLKDSLSKDRYKHTLGVEETAVKMAKIYGVDEKKASLAALLHDSAKELSKDQIIEMAVKEGWPISKLEEKQPKELLHAPASAHIASQIFDIKDRDILQAITFHTLGNENMTPLEMIIFVADMVEANRSYPGVEELRSLAYIDLKNAAKACLEHTLSFLNNKKVEIHPQTSKTYQSLKDKIE